jgi:WhiB family transcriptional regulator, redox-sensing transcriptional regulator
MTWLDDAPCRGLTHLFYPSVANTGRRGNKNIDPYARARLVCQSCPYQQPCLAVADDHGMWGGQDPDQRHKAPQPGRCRQCGQWTNGRLYCTQACKSRAHRRRGAA